mmetsp:Transcript_50566/g.97793  ORF Transcript_50566/g.97793 Transcript_50566/m.97793 type:complete len:568 (-) Transcript_50566:257-1960(-)
MLLERFTPDTTTVIRWVLRVVLVFFLAWLVRRRPDQEEEEDEAAGTSNGGAQSPSSAAARRTGAVKPRTVGTRTTPSRLQGRQTQYPPGVRQRRPQGFGGIGEAVDFDAVIQQVSKPKDMWEHRKAGDAPQIVRRQPSSQDLDGGATPKESTSNVGKTAGVRETKGRENTLHGHERPVTFITWNRDCNLIFTCGKDKIVCVWSFPDGECLGSYEGHSGAVWACSITADSRWLVTSGADRLVIVWEAKTSREISRVELPGVVRFVEWTGGSVAASASATPPASERFVTCHNRFGGHPPAVTVWRFDGTAIEELLRITTLPTPATQVRWGRSDYFVVSAHENGELIFWRADTGAEVKRLRAHESPITKFDFSADRELVATVSHDKFLRLWDLGKGTDWKQLYHAETDRPLNAVAVGPLTRAAAAGPVAERPARCSLIAAGGQDVRDVARSSSATEQFGTLLFRLGSGESFPSELQADGVTKGHFGPVHTLAFARDGSAIASGSEDGCVRLHILDPNTASHAPAVVEAPAATLTEPADQQHPHEEAAAAPRQEQQPLAASSQSAEEPPEA